MNYVYLNQRLIQFFAKRQRLSLRESCQEFLIQHRVKLEVTGKFPIKGPVLVVSNHQTMLDLFYFFSLFQRNDAYFLGAVINEKLGKKWQERLLPVYLSRHPVLKFHGRLRQFLWTMREGWLSREEATKRNRQTVTRAAEHLKAGHVVLLFPTGKRFHHQHNYWARGIAHLLKEAQPLNVQVVFVHIGPTFLLQNLRQYFPTFLLKRLPTLTVKMRVFSPQTFPRKTLNHLTPADLTTFLKQEYDRLLL